MSYKLFYVLCSLVVANALVSCVSAPKIAKTSSDPVQLGEWSNVVEGMRGRLAIAYFDDQGKPFGVRTDGDTTFGVYIELQNVGHQARTMALQTPYTMNNKEYLMALTDSKGMFIAHTNDGVGYEAGIGFKWIEVNPDSIYRFCVTSGSYEARSSRTKVALSMDRPWLLSNNRPQSYGLSCTFSPLAAEDNSAHMQALTALGPRTEVDIFR